MAVRRAFWIVVSAMMLLAVSACQAAPSATAPAQGETPRGAPTETSALPTATPMPQPSRTSAATPTPQPDATATQPPSGGPVADVIAVDVTGQPGSYTFSVEVASPDQGCEQYADWWEVVSEDGALVYRRILLHSHVNEQPFTRSGGPVEIQPGSTVWVRAHVHPSGYGGQAFRGSVEAGFSPADPPPGFAQGLVEQPPLPDGCVF
jgi:hypothetical protein